MVNTGYLQSLLSLLHEAYSYHQDPRPSRRPPDVIGRGEASLFTLLSHLVLADSHVFLTVINTITVGNDPNTLTWLLTEWFHQYDATADTLRRKTQLLALTSLLSVSPSPTPLLSSLQSLFTIYTDTLIELADGAAEENRGDYLFSPALPGEMLPNWPDSDSPEDVRKRQVANWDPVYVINARDFVAKGLRQAVQECGGQQAFEQQWIADRIDQDVVRAFAALGVL